jgi:ribonuclease E
MTKRMLIDAAHAEETRVVVVDGTRIEEFDFESQSRKQLRGNIYLAKVTRVEPSLQAAFIEYGGNRHGFLAFNEIHPDYYHIPAADKEALLREEVEEEEAHARAAAAGGGRRRARKEEPTSDDIDGEDDVQASASDDDDDDDDMEEAAERRRRRLMRRYKIQEVIKRRQIMLVQVVKEERGNKGAALTTYLSLAGRYCVLMPNTARGGGISRKITTATDRKRLKGIVQSLEVPEGMGLIVRTAGAKRTKAEIKRDYEYLLRLWENIRENTMSSIAPALIYEEEDLVKRAIRDMYDKDLEGIVVEGEEGYREARDFMRMLMPSQAKKITAYREPTPLFVKAKVEDQLAQVYNPVVPLKSGGYLVINQTEALVAVDVNSGRSTRERNIESTALKTNLEAAEEAARQLRLRDLAGLIVIDFIDMDEAKNNRAVEKKLKDALKDDRARIQVGRISGFGLMEISRQRRRTGVLEGTTHVCPTCEGSGRVRATESSALSALRSVEMEAVRGGPGSVILKAPSACALYILNEKRAYLTRLEATQGLKLAIQIDDTLSRGDVEIERVSTLSPEDRAQFTPAVVTPAPDFEADFADDVVEDEDDEADDIVEIEADGETLEPTSDRDDGRGGRRRRRRGRGRSRDEEAPRPALSPAGDEDEVDGDVEAAGDDDQDGRRRRRRGRRGGRRAREDVRPADVYGWTRVRVPHTDGVYTWFDPASLPPPQDRPERFERTDRPVEALPVAAEAAEPAPSVYAFVDEAAGEPPAPVVEAANEDIWVELPAVEEPAPKPKRRTRSRKAAAAPEPDAEAPVAEAAVPEPVVVTEVASPEPVVMEAAAPAPAPEPEPEPESEPAAAEVAPAEPDPNEISAPPPQPKRGWWRRGA